MKMDLHENLTPPEVPSGGTGKTSRAPNLDLLRIISILMIVAGHIMNVFIGGVLQDVEQYSLNYFLGWIFQAYVIVGVNCFVLLTGYFMCTQRFKLKRLVLLWLEMVLYAVGITLILSAAGVQSLSIGSIVKGLLPISTNYDWFVRVYVLLCCAAPLLNRLISALDKRQHLGGLCGLLLIYSLWATAAGFGDFSGVAQGFSLYWFMILYLIAAYIRNYDLPNLRPRSWMLLFLGTGLLLGITKPAISMVTQVVLGEPMISGAFYIYNSPFVLAASIFLFMFCRSITIKNKTACRVICYLAPLSLGVQLLHTHRGLKTLWVDVLHPRTYANSPIMLLYVLLCTVLIYVACVVIDAVRRALFRPLQGMAWPERLQEAWSGMLDRLNRKI